MKLYSGDNVDNADGISELSPLARASSSNLTKIQAKEADVQALAELTRALDKKGSYCSGVEANEQRCVGNSEDGGSSLKDSEPFKKQYAAVLIQLNEANEQFPLVSRSGRIRKLVAEHRDSDISGIELPGLPGGATHLSWQPSSVMASISRSLHQMLLSCCVSDYLEMTEEYSKNNLGSRCEEYLESIVYKNLEMCVEVLQM
ncbi:UNVERIFIED_CONTAM: BTB/POZ domain-containing protein [Sesamum angustifolium]|uniref:BTB/POZ domain-containing protein n=1 Tax=Sesamum angustifolium TaxID=2727405 RepID=A0AAW2JMB7_9LAMI